MILQFRFVEKRVDVANQVVIRLQLDDAPFAPLAEDLVYALARTEAKLSQVVLAKMNIKVDAFFFFLTMLVDEFE